MLTWAHGTISITGDKQALSRFIKRLIYPKSLNPVLVGTKYFPRVFVEGVTRETIMSDINDLFADGNVKDEERLTLPDVEFAYSATKCLVSGYPELWLDKCISLRSACAIDGVSVTVEAVNYDTNIEEIICAEPDGELIQYDGKISEYCCASCGNIEPIPALYTTDPLNYTCPVCQQCNWMTLDGRFVS